MKKKAKRIDIKLKDRNKVLDSILKIHQKRESNGDKNKKINILLVCQDLNMSHAQIMPIIRYLADKDFLEYIPPLKRDNSLNIAVINGKLCEFDVESVPPQDFVILKQPGRTYFTDMNDKKREHGVTVFSTLVSFLTVLVDKMSGLNIVKTLKSLLQDNDS